MHMVKIDKRFEVHLGSQDVTSAECNIVIITNTIIITTITTISITITITM